MLAFRGLLITLLLVSCSYAQEEGEQLVAANNQIAQLTAERDNALKKLAAAEANRAKAVQDLDASKNAIADLTKKVLDLSAELKTEAIKASGLQKQLLEATSEASKHLQEIERLKLEVSTTREAQAAALREYQTVRQSEQALRDELHTNAARIQHLEHKLVEAEQGAAKSMHESAAAAAAKADALAELQQKIKQLETNLAANQAHTGKQQQETALLEAKIKALQRSLANSEADLAKVQHAASTSGDELQALLRQAQESWLPLWLQYRILQAQEFIVQLLDDLKGGKHGPYGVHVHSLLDVANTHATNAFVYVKPHVDKGYAAASHHAGKAYAAAKPHLDDGLSKLTVAVDKARAVLEAHWKKYVTDAEWTHELKAAYTKVEQELVREVSKLMRDIPALKPYSDPVTVQLLVYVIFLVPVLVILVPALALLCSRSSSASKDGPKRSRQEKPKPGHGPGHGHGKRPHKRV